MDSTRPLLDWTPPGPLLDLRWASTGPLLGLYLISIGPLLDLYWASIGFFVISALPPNEQKASRKFGI